MTWSDKPTKAQIGMLVGTLEAYLDEELDYAKETGATTKREAIRIALSVDVVRGAVEDMVDTCTRGEFSRMIERAERDYWIPAEVKSALDEFLEDYGVVLDYERVQEKWRNEREQSQMG